ncbi:MAG: TetR family transcriptional regulator [Catenulispora sp.]|nr:TetR family transcriptional regulator [Catenulispora sp.]
MRTPEPTGAEGLRERKKRLTRQQLTDTATRMFLEKGFDAVRVSEVAAACGVSEKTVFNYFPTKEALVLDQFETTPEVLRAALSTPGPSPVDAVLEILAEELAAITYWMAAQADFATAVKQVALFGRLIGTTPALQAHQRAVLDRLTRDAAQVLAARPDLGIDDIEASVAANALLGLWPAQFAALRKHLGRADSAAALFAAVSADVRRTARIIRYGLQGRG